MSITELKQKCHNFIDEIEDEKLIQDIYDFLKIYKKLDSSERTHLEKEFENYQALYPKNN